VKKRAPARPRPETLTIPKAVGLILDGVRANAASLTELHRKADRILAIVDFPTVQAERLGHVVSLLAGDELKDHPKVVAAREKIQAALELGAEAQMAPLTEAETMLEQEPDFADNMAVKEAVLHLRSSVAAAHVAAGSPRVE
jgi:hypothetical protein